MNGFFHRQRLPQTSLDAVIDGLSYRSDDRAVRAAIEMLFEEPLPPDEHDRQSERIRRITRLNRATFRRYMRYAQEAVQQRGQ